MYLCTFGFFIFRFVVFASTRYTFPFVDPDFGSQNNAFVFNTIEYLFDVCRILPWSAMQYELF